MRKRLICRSVTKVQRGPSWFSLLLDLVCVCVCETKSTDTHALTQTYTYIHTVHVIISQVLTERPFCPSMKYCYNADHQQALKIKVVVYRNSCDIFLAQLV